MSTSDERSAPSRQCARRRVAARGTKAAVLNRSYQIGFSERYRGVYYNQAGRHQKGAKILAVLGEEMGRLSTFDAVDLGCSTGFVAKQLSEHFARVIGLDMDESAIGFARRQLTSSNLAFRVGDAMATGLADGSCDVVVCTHVYEHVLNPAQMLAEIHRILRPGGVCYFAAANRLRLVDAEHGLPLLSWLPARLARMYVRMSRRSDDCHERFYTYWGLRRLVAAFEVHDYTERVVRDPVRYAATDVIRPRSRAQRVGLQILRRVYWLCPGYIWILRRR